MTVKLNLFFIFILTTCSLRIQAEVEHPTSTEPYCSELKKIESNSENINFLLKKLNTSYSLSCSKWIYNSCHSPFRVDNAFSNSQKNLGIINKKILEKAQSLYETNENNRKEDLRLILSTYQSENFPFEISNEQLLLSLKTLNDHIFLLPKSNLGIQANFLKQYVANQIIEASEDIKTKWKDEYGILHEDTEDGFLSVLAKLKSNSERMQLLIKTAQQNSERGRKDFIGNLTPYHAKMLLIFHLDNLIRHKHRYDVLAVNTLLNGLAKKLNLKAHYGNSSMLWSDIVPHDGFVIGASLNQVNNFIKNAPSSALYGKGIDCTTFVQNILVSSGLKFLDVNTIGRLTSYGAVSKNQLQSIAKIVPLKTINDIITLTPGDLIFQREDGEDSGHVEIFAGYEGDPVKLITINASGGLYRSILKRYIDIVEDLTTFDCDKSNHFNHDKKV
ncbi:MAG: hypothetical protein L6Q37_04415, partial [Bdellovibrionaceae bacterium]|nr:hypothetical protein [Pseudobdellovibrionaceae bacterium]